IRRRGAFSWYAMSNGGERSGSSVLGVLPRMRGGAMKAKRQTEENDMRPEYDFDYSAAVRGKYYRRLMKEGANIVVLEPDVAKAFRNSTAVNEALRSLLKVARSARRLTSRSGRTARKHTAT